MFRFVAQAMAQSGTMASGPGEAADKWASFAEKFGFPAALVVLLIAIVVVLLWRFDRTLERKDERHAKEREDQSERHAKERERAFNSFLEQLKGVADELKEHNALERETQQLFRDHIAQETAASAAIGHEIREIRTGLSEIRSAELRPVEPRPRRGG